MVNASTKIDARPPPPCQKWFAYCSQTQVLFDLAVAYPLARKQFAVHLEESAVALAITIFVLTIPKIAVRPIIDSVTMAATTEQLAIIGVAIGIYYLFKGIQRLGSSKRGNIRRREAQVALGGMHSQYMPGVEVVLHKVLLATHTRHVGSEGNAKEVLSLAILPHCLRAVVRKEITPTV